MSRVILETFSHFAYLILHVEKKQILSKTPSRRIKFKNSAFRSVRQRRTRRISNLIASRKRAIPWVKCGRFSGKFFVPRRNVRGKRGAIRGKSRGNIGETNEKRVEREG